MTTTLKHNGIEISDVIDGYLVIKVYVGYTVRDAQKEWKRYIKTLKNGGNV